MEKPTLRPACPNFSCGPTRKPPTWSLEALKDGCFGRSHRSALSKSKLAEVIDRTRALLDIPADYRIEHCVCPRHRRGGNGHVVAVRRARGVTVLAWGGLQP